MRKSVPNYQKIKEYIYAQVKTGALLPNDQLPPQSELMEMFEVSRGTVHKAISELIEEGLIYGIHGLGSFIANSSSDALRMAPSPHENTMKIIGLIFPYDFHFNPELLGGIESQLSSHQYRVIVCNSDEDPEKEEQVTSQLISEGVSGLIIYTSFTEKNHAPLIKLQKSGFPFVIITSHISTFPCDFVVSNNVNGGYLAGKHLCELGHRSLAVITWTDFLDRATVKERLIGFGRALSEHDAAFSGTHVFGCTQEEFRSQDKHYPANQFYSPLKKPIQNAFKKISGLSAIFCINDVIALEVLRCLKHLNIRVPEDISIIGFDNSAFTTHLPVPLSTIKQDFYEIGRTAAETLLSKIEKTSDKFHSVYLPVHLIPRESTGEYQAGL